MCKAELVNQDCLDYLKTLPDKSAALVLTDPPYEISRDTNFQSKKASGKDTDRFRVSMDFGDWDKDFTDLSEAVRECYRVLKDGGTMICFYDIWKITVLRRYFENAGFRQIRFIEWLKTNPVPLNSSTNYLTDAREAAVVGVKKSRPVFHSCYDNGVYRYPICHEKGRFHPTQKPVALLEEIIQKHSDKGDMVLDCFAGSGSTAVAALQQGRNFRGCEISEEFYEKAMKRLSEMDSEK